MTRRCLPLLFSTSGLSCSTPDVMVVACPAVRSARRFACETRANMTLITRLVLACFQLVFLLIHGLSVPLEFAGLTKRVWLLGQDQMAQ